MSDTKNKYFVHNVSPEQCRISRFNTRKTRGPEEVTKLAERMQKNGFEMTRALWVYENEGLYEVFAGGTRLEAARQAGIPVDVIVHEGFTWEEISRLGDDDNENDEYHQPVLPMDVWAEYARLAAPLDAGGEKWTQQQIADAKGVSQALVSNRLGFHKLPEELKLYVGGGLLDTPLTEHHLEVVLGGYRMSYNLDTDLSRWATWDSWRVCVLKDVIAKPKSARELEKIWEGRKEAVKRADELVDKLSGTSTDEYRRTTSGEIVRVETNWPDLFVSMLIEDGVLSAGMVDRVFAKVVARRAQSDLNKTILEEKWTQQEVQAKIVAEKIDALTSCWLRGDSTELVAQLPDNSVRLVLTDPPYGVDFQSNRRVVKGKADKIAGDLTVEEAIKLFKDVMGGLAPKLTDAAHILVFTHWRVEQEFKAALEELGYEVRGSLVWVKRNHSSGDLTGSFAPKHERIIHATKGHPTLAPRMDDVIDLPYTLVTAHPTEKPVEILQPLIECTTVVDDLIIDPFAGTGSTLVAGTRVGRKVWGCELEQVWWDDGYKRLSNELR